MGWTDAISAGYASGLDDARRRLAELESSAHDAIDKVKDTASNAASTLSDTAASAIAFGADHASDVVAAAKNAGESALATAKSTTNASNARAQFGVPNLDPGGYHAAKQAQKEQQTQAQQPKAPEEQPLIGPVPVDRWSDDFLHRTITAQRRKVNDTPEGPARDAAKSDLGDLEAEAHRRTLAREYEDRPDDQPPAEKARLLRNPSGHEWAALATGFSSGMAATAAGPFGMAWITMQDAAVEKYASPEDRRAYGTGEMLAGELDVGLGVAGMLGGGAVEVGSAGAGSAVAVPAMGVGAVAAASGGVLIAKGHALSSKGTPSTSTTATPAAPTEQKNKVPRAIDDAHIFDGEIKYDSRGAPTEAMGCHHMPKGSENQVRIQKGTQASTPDKNGVYTAHIEVKDPRTKTWVAKPQETSCFPESWDRSRIRQEIREAYANSTVDANGVWKGKSASGVNIKGFVDRTTKTNITSAWPIYEP